MNTKLRGLLRGSVALSALLCLQCAAHDIDDESASDDSVGTQQQAITNGYIISDDNHMGFVALQVWRGSPQNSFITVCTGTLMKNNKVITARHCLRSWPEILYAKMGTQRIEVAAPRYEHSSFDVAVLKLVGRMKMWNWRDTGHLTSPPQLNYTDYSRAIYSGTNASLNGRTLPCVGYGGASFSGPFQPPLTYADFKMRYPTGMTGLGDIILVGLTHVNPSTALIDWGDSGGPCLSNILAGTYGSPIAGVHSVFGGDGGFDVGAENWRDWAIMVIAGT